ncbi:MAG: extracellular solute-binding protein [Clostridia bacterium]|nr:extracellular solute-binding protein [Clostridia bacterium]
MKKLLSMVLAVSMSAGLLAACGGGDSQTTADGKVVISVGNWPDEEGNPKLYATRMELKAEFEAKYPDIVIEPDSWAYDLRTFAAKAEGGTLPTIYNTHATELKKIIDLEYSADITEQMEKYGYYDTLSEEIAGEISKDGKVYMIPSSAYSLGIVMNLNLFKEAGLMKADGTPEIPETFDDVRKMAKIIKDKTGKAGFLFPTTENGGGWNFTNLAWSFGGSFMEETENGWKADFTEGVTDALKFLRDMKWEDGSLPVETLINNSDAMKLVATDQAAMAFAHPDQINILTSQYDMDTDAIGYTKMAEGPAGRIALMGGSYIAFSPEATSEQIDAAFKWLIFKGDLPATELTDEIRESVRRSQQEKIDANRVVGIKDISLWSSASEVQAYKDQVIEELRNINEKNIATYNDKTGLTYQTEEKMCAQDLYALLDSCIQEVLTNEGADCQAVLDKAESDFQNNYLNNEN